MFNFKAKHFSRVLSTGHKCPHCGKGIFIDYKIDHRHTFKTDVDTVNSIKQMTVVKDPDVK